MKYLKHIYMYFVLFAIVFKFALTSDQWLLTVDLHQFHNLYNAERRGVSWFCCCNIPPDSGPCETISSSLPICVEKCDTQFFVSVSECQSPPSCKESTEILYNSLANLKLDYLFVFILSSSPKMDLTLTIQASDDEADYPQEEIDVFSTNIPFEPNTECISENIMQYGKNNIGIFNFSYQMYNINFEDTYKCFAESSTKGVTVLPTMANIPSCNDESVNGTDLQTTNSSGSISAWIGATVLFMLLTLAFLTISIILMCVVYHRKMDMKAENNQQVNSLDKQEKFEESADTTPSQGIAYGVDNCLYQVANFSEQPYPEYPPTVTEKKVQYERTTTNSYETPLPVHVY